jgi:hypothetical protein
MRFKLLLRRLTVSAPRMSVRSALPWPLRWVVLAVMAGFCAAIALWAFETGREWAGLDGGAKVQLVQAQAELLAAQENLRALQVERDEARRVANTADTLMTAEKAAQARLQEVNQRLQADNQRLKSDLGLFEKWLQAGGPQSGQVTIRGLRAQLAARGRLEWQVLVVQSEASTGVFKGQLEMRFQGQLNGRPWSYTDKRASKSLSFERYGRVDGVYTVPARVRVSSVTARVLDGDKVLSEHTARL